MTPRTVAVIPAHNEARTIAAVVRDTLLHVDAALVVDDGSSDDTAALAEQAGATVLRQSPNAGKGLALRRGIDAALQLGAECVVTLDGDGEHVPSDIPTLLAPLQYADVVLGTRQVFRSPARKLINAFALFWFRLLDPAILDTICGFRAFRAAALPELRSDANGFAYEHEVILRAVQRGLRLASVSVQVVSREGTHVTAVEILRSNNHFDRYVLRNLAQFRVALWRKGLLAIGCGAGLVVGVPVLWHLSRRPRSG